MEGDVETEKLVSIDDVLMKKRRRRFYMLM
jgi:hypothetical protein